jgi:uncharacterized protein (UPF0335 family)
MAIQTMPFPPSPPLENEPPVRAREGHNSSVAPEMLKSIIERIERLHEERQAIAGDISDVYGEAKGNGFDTKIIRKIIAMRKKDAAERAEEDAMMDLYLDALGMS